MSTISAHPKGHPSHSHPYHLVDPSPWPLVGAVSALVLAWGGANYFHNRANTWGLALGLALLVITMVGWWRDVIREARDGHSHTPAVRRGLKLGFALFIISEAMFFVGFFWAFFHSALKVSPAITQWPPAGIHVLDAWGIPFVNTLILLSSGVTLTWAHHALIKGQSGAAVRWLSVTVALGVIFLGLQAHEYGEALFGFKDGVYPSVFYMATGFHGFHVFVGVCFLAVCLGRTAKGHFTPTSHLGLEAAAWYWHFVDAVWIFLFVWVYWWGNG